MTNRFVVDTYAWIEYLISSKTGEIVREIVENRSNKIYTNIVTLSEIISKTKREGMDAKTAFDAVTTLSIIYKADENFAFNVGMLHAEMKKSIKDIGLADVFVLATANETNAKIITGDKHFKGLRNIVFLGN